MPIDIPPPTQLLRQLESQHRSVLESLAKTSAATIDKAVTALIREIAPASPQQIRALLEASPQSPAAPVPKTPLQAAPGTLKLVLIELQNQTLLAFTGKDLQPGDKIELYSKEGQLHFRTPVQPHDAAMSRSAMIERTIEQSVRTSLPLQQPLPPLLTQIVALAKNSVLTLDQSREPHTQNVSSKELVNILQALIGKSKTPEQLHQPGQLKQHLADSGLFLEKKLFSTAKEQLLTPVTRDSTKPLSPSSNLLNALVTFLKKPETANHRAINQTSKTADPATPINSNIKPMTANLGIENTDRIKESSQQDIKSLLSQAKQLVEEMIKNGIKVDYLPGSNNQSLPAKNMSAHSSLDVLFLQWLKPLKAQTSAHSNVSQRKDNALNSLLQNITGALARIQLQQAHVLYTSTTQADAQLQHLQLDIPIKQDGIFSHVELEIREEWQEKNAEQQDENEKTKQWSVLLNFNIPQVGKLAARVRLRGDRDEDNNVNIHFWVEKSHLQEEINSKLGDLRKQLVGKGVTIEEILCNQGVPSQKTNQLSFALVDVKT